MDKIPKKFLRLKRTGITTDLWLWDLLPENFFLCSRVFSFILCLLFPNIYLAFRFFLFDCFFFCLPYAIVHPDQIEVFSLPFIIA